MLDAYLQAHLWVVIALWATLGPAAILRELKP